ncbi:MAG: pyridoxal-phosphate dependent enzyme, partial [Chlorobiota bacterium]
MNGIKSEVTDLFKPVTIPRTTIEPSGMFPTGNISVQRFDLVHPLLQGNKWYKLKLNVRKCLEEGKDTVLSFGGAYSNHIHALAAAGKLAGLKTIGVIRGERTEPLNHTLREAEDFGMRLHFVSRTEFRRRYSPDYITELRGLFGDFYFVPEGGSNLLGYHGAMEMLPDDAGDFSHILMATGSGGTIGGNLLAAARRRLKDIKVISVPVLKDHDYVLEGVRSFLQTEGMSNFELLEVLPGYHHGGYAKFSDELISFINDFQSEYKIAIDPVYTGKVLFAVSDLSNKGYFRSNDRILVYHTGGTQGM